MTTMPGTPSPAEFLAGPSYDEDDLDYMEQEPTPDTRTPLERLTDLERRVTALAGLINGGFIELTLPVEEPAFAAIEAASETEEPAGVDYYEELRFVSEQYADLEAKHGTVLALIEEIRGIVKPSTSKVSLAVKKAIETWADPQVPAGEPGEPETEPEGGESTICVQCGETFPNVVALQAHGTRKHGANFDYRDPTEQEGVGAPVQCDSCNRFFTDAERLALHNCPMSQAMPAADASVEEWRAYARGLGYTGSDVDTMNRSQVRTMLGIEQPVGA